MQKRMPGRLEHLMKLGKLATTNVLTIQVTDSLDTAISLMDEHNIHHLPVLDGESVAGIISDRDLLISVGWRLARERTVGDEDEVAGPTRASQVMRTPVITLPPDATVHDAAREMIDQNISALVLTGFGDTVVGIVTKLDLLGRMAYLAKADATLSMLDEPVERHMRASVVTAGPKSSVQEVVSLMHEKHIRHLPIVAGGTVLGIVSDRDVRRACGVEMVEDEQAEQNGEVYVGSDTVLEIMSYNVQTTTRSATLLAACEQMVEHHIGCLPVLHDSQLVGILTDTDLVRILSHAEV